MPRCGLGGASGFCLFLALLFACLSLGHPAPADEPEPEQLEFFERRIRPVLMDTCGECHADGKQSEAGLDVTRLESLLSGGASGPAIEPGDPEASLLIKAIRRDLDASAHMPPEEILPPEQVADLVAWVEMGAPWPEENEPLVDTADEETYWAFRPVRSPPVPDVTDTNWPQTAIDRFILAGLEQAALRPAPSAERRELLRRLTFDLTGLPPTPDEIERFLADESPDAYARVVERLLASPRYGERWARHWLDLMRYSDTNGLDNDYKKPNAYRYRDYVIRALNDDLPYDVFVREHVAGDLLANQRTSRDGIQYLSPQATASLWLGEMLNAPAQPEVALANELENRMDVVGKAFLGLTLACARCHDHKFDDITSEDYYAIAGILTSSTNVQQCVDTPSRGEQVERLLSDIENNARARQRLLDDYDVQRARLEAALEAARSIETLLMATQHLVVAEQAPSGEAIAAAAESAGLPAEAIGRWTQFLRDEERLTDPLFAGWTNLVDAPERSFARRRQALARRLTAMVERLDELAGNRELFEDFESDAWPAGWHAAGAAFAAGPTTALPRDLVGHQGNGVASSLRWTEAATGRLTSAPFKVTKRYMTMLVAGGDHYDDTRVNVILNSQVLPEPEDVVKHGAGDHHMRRQWFNMQPYLDHEVQIELVDEARGEWGHLIIDEISFTDDDPPPPEFFACDPVILATLDDDNVATRRDLAARYQQRIVDVLEDAIRQVDDLQRTSDGSAEPQVVRLSDRAAEAISVWALSLGSPLNAPALETLLDDAQEAQLVELREAQQLLDEAMPRSVLAITTVDDRVADMPIHRRGDPNNLGDPVSRGFIAALSDDPRPVELQGSGRLELAHWMASAENPLTVRVLVNRAWLHHFGQGLVRTPDNFGLLGETPTHPQLLDYLAAEFIRSGWSLKRLHRLIVLSATYQQSGLVTTEARQHDPDNRLWHHVPPRALEAEAVRDAMLSVSGDLHAELYGRPIATHITPFMVGEDLPPYSGPLDGDARRSIYLEVRSNHLMGLLKAFHLERPSTTVGRRDRSVVTPMALSLMNNEFVWLEARAWAERLLADGSQSPEQRIVQMFAEAFARPPRDDELQTLVGFVDEQRHRYASLEAGAEDAGVEQAVWADVAHVLFNLAEFYFVR